MHFNDKPELRKKLVEMGRAVGRNIDTEDANAYFNQLEEFPIDLIARGMDKALRDRDPNDIYLRTTIVTVPEIRAAIEDLAKPEEGQLGTIASCQICHGTAWIMGHDKDKRAIAWPCACLYAVAKEALKTKSKSTSRENHNKRIVRAYEYHQQNFGGMDENGQKI